MDLKQEFEVAKSRTMFIAHEFILHASRAYQTCLKRFLEGYESGLTTGDVEMASWNIVMYLEMSFLIGKSLPSLNEDWDFYTKQMKSVRQMQQYNIATNK